MTMIAALTLTVSASAMSYEQARSEALFLTDKMAYELNLTNAQREAVYEINLDYMMSIDGYGDMYGNYWSRRNSDILYVLSNYQYRRYLSINYFYRPVSWTNNAWYFGVHRYYTNPRKFYYRAPTAYEQFRGGRNTGNSYYRGRSYINSRSGSWRNNSTRNHSYNNGNNNSYNRGNNGNYNNSGNSNYGSGNRNENNSGSSNYNNGNNNYGNGNNSSSHNGSNRGFNNSSSGNNNNNNSSYNQQNSNSRNGSSNSSNNSHQGQSRFGGHR